MAAAPYPRPDFVRTKLVWQSLNGLWDFIFDDDNVGLLEDWHLNGLPSEAKSTQHNSTLRKRTIEVPFVFQSKASGINEQDIHEVLWYERTIKDLRYERATPADNRLLLRFGAVDYEARVWLNGIDVGSHRGGHVPFDLDLTDAIILLSRLNSAGPYRLTVRVFDSATDTSQPRGKQYWGPVPESIWYTPSSGIWQNVWLESVPKVRIADPSFGTILRAHDSDGGELDARIAVLGRSAGVHYLVNVEVNLEGLMTEACGSAFPKDEDFVRERVAMRLRERRIQQLPQSFLQNVSPEDRSCWREGVALWSPEHPVLYDVIIRLFNKSFEGELLDEVKTTIGVRSLNWTAGDGTFRLNGGPYFQALLLDQGYWPDTLMTPPTQDSLKKDIELSKAMGFNGCRKHQKVEDPAFLYWADRLGFLVWGEMASCHRFSIDATDRFEKEWMEMVGRDINHPCVVTWTPANESWGYPQLSSNIRQRNHLRSLYYQTKTLDWTRPINDNCGWDHVVTDLSTFHSYDDADGMEKRCTSIGSIIDSGRSMFLRPIHGVDGEYDQDT